MFDVDVLLVQFNPKWEQLQVTLDSIVQQKKVKINLIIADDGSNDNMFGKIKEYIEPFKDINTIFLEKDVNKGTVLNMIDGLEFCKSNYLKPISPGDIIYSNDCLYTVFKYMDEKKIKIAFGRMAFYNLDRKSNKLSLLAKQRPFNLNPYIKCKNATKNMMIYGDSISGASCFWETEIYKKMMKLIANIVKYQEDLIIAYCAYLNERIYYIDRYVIWYEYNTGISTGDNYLKWKHLLDRDSLNFYNLIKSKNPQSLIIRRALYLKKIKSGILKTLLYPDRFFYTRIIMPCSIKKVIIPDVKLLEPIFKSNFDIELKGKFLKNND